MKFLIDQYSDTSHNTQSMYFYHHLNSGNNEAYITNPKVSMFDNLDVIQPDVYLTSVRTIKRDYIEYQKQNNHRIKTFVNIDGCKVGDIVNVLEFLKENKVTVKLFGNETKKHKVDIKDNVLHVLDAVDEYIDEKHAHVFNVQEKKFWAKKINRLFVMNEVSEFKNIELLTKNKTFHIYSHDKKADVSTNLVSFYFNLAHNYDEIIFADIHSRGISQMFLQSIHSGTPTYYFDTNNNYDDMISKILNTNETLNIMEDSRITNFENVITHINNKHMSKNRIKTILSQLPQEVYA